MKISKFICYYFYKNIILVLINVFFSINNGFSGQIFFADALTGMYNAIFTSWPCVFTFSLEKDFELEIVKSFPILYAKKLLFQHKNTLDVYYRRSYSQRNSFFYPILLLNLRSSRSRLRRMDTFNNKFQYNNPYSHIQLSY